VNPLPSGVRRVLVAGSTGAGKSTMARALADLLELPYTELDCLQQGPGRAPRPEFEDEVDAMLAAGSWVTEYQYRGVKERLLAAADAVVWLDHPFPLVVGRLLRRSVLRAVTRRPLCTGDVERVASWLRPSHPLRIVFSPAFAAQRSAIAPPWTVSA
jgi:adenylate kinase family enzyme